MASTPGWYPSGCSDTAEVAARSRRHERRRHRQVGRLRGRWTAVNVEWTQDGSRKGCRTLSAWTTEVEPTRINGGAVTLVEGSSFCICTPGGDLRGVEPHGVFFRDTRILSRWDLQIDGETPEPLAAMTPDPYHGMFLGRVSRPAGGWATACGRTWWSATPRERVVCTVAIDVEADFADLFQVKEGRDQARGERRAQEEGTRLVLDQRWREDHRGVVVLAPGRCRTVLNHSDALWVAAEPLHDTRPDESLRAQH